MLGGQGFNPADGKSEFALARYLPSGALDPSFGNGGVVGTALPYSEAGISSLALLPDGRIVAGGYTHETTPGCKPCLTEVALARYLRNGALDPSFGSQGTLITTAFPQTFSGATSLAVRPDGKILVGGSRIRKAGPTKNPYPAPLLVRYRSNGSLDPSFGKARIATGPARLNRLDAIALQRDGKIVVAGEYDHEYKYVNSRYAVARYRANGTLDPSFGRGGNGPLAGTGELFALAKQKDGEVVAAGVSTDPRGANYAFGLVRYLAGSNCVVPYLRAKTLAEAKRSIRRAYCRVGQVSERRSTKVETGR